MSGRQSIILDWSATVPVADRAKTQAGRLRSSPTLLEWL